MECKSMSMLHVYAYACAHVDALDKLPFIRDKRRYKTAVAWPLRLPLFLSPIYPGLRESRGPRGVWRTDQQPDTRPWRDT
jgi:hypothetical protein